MLLTFILFLISLIGIIALLMIRSKQLKKIDYSEHSTGPIFIDKKLVRKIAKKSFIITRNVLHITFLEFTRYRILLGRKISNFFEKKFPKFYALFSTKHAIQAAQEAKSVQTSFFWRSVAEYKYKVKTMKHEIMQEEKEKKQSETIQENIDTENQ